jgi:mono/diheme cytochrome c family protein
MLRAALALALLFSQWGCSSKPIDPSPEGVYLARCVRCHEIDGSSITASEQADRPVDLRSVEFQRGTSDEEIRHIAIYGKDRMQGIQGLTDEQADSVVVYVRRLASTDGSSTP